MIGRQLSHYRIVAELGSGGMGTVYRAEDTRGGDLVALKLPHPARVADPAARARLLDAARAVAALTHENIVGVREAGEDGGHVFLVMPLAEGCSLRERMHGALPARRVVAIGHAIARALACAHEHGVVHGDVKPENVLLCDDEVPRLADFELEHAADGAMVGTAEYLAPERLRGAPADARTDLYALGVLLYELCVGTPPFAGTPAELLRRAASEPPPPLPVSVPARLAELIEALLAKRPEDRPDSAARVADTLAALRPPEAA